MSSDSTARVLRGGPGLDDARADALRVLAMEGVQRANSGHPGAPMGMAEMAVAPRSGHRRHDPARPDWPDRESVLAPALPSVAVEAGHPDFSRKYVGRSGAVIGIATFGESAPAADRHAHFGIAADAVARAVASRLSA